MCSHGTLDTPGQTRVNGPLRARAVLMLGPACPKVVRSELLRGYRWQAPGSQGHTRTTSLSLWQPGAAWKLTRMLPDLCWTEGPRSESLHGDRQLLIGGESCTLMETLAPVYLAGNLVCLGFHDPQRGRRIGDATAQKGLGMGSALEPEGPATIAGITPPGGHPQTVQGNQIRVRKPWSTAQKGDDEGQGSGGWNGT